MAENVTPIVENVTSKSEDVTPIVEKVTSKAENVTSIVEDVTSILVADVIDPEDVAPIRENVTPVTATDDEELKKKNKKENTPTTPKEKNKIKNPHIHARVSQRKSSTTDVRRSPT